MSSQQIHFYDSANPAAIPSGVYAAVYINGFEWPAAQIARMGRIFSVSVRPETSYANVARCIDIETGAAAPSDAVTFVQERRKRFNDATCYVNRSNWQLVRQLFTDAREPEPLWWVATLDGTQNIPGAWAVQYYGGMHTAYDLSILHGVDNFHTP